MFNLKKYWISYCCDFYENAEVLNFLANEKLHVTADWEPSLLFIHLSILVYNKRLLKKDLFFLTDVPQDISRIFFNKAKVRKSMAIPSKFDMAQARGSDKSGP